MDLVPYFPLAGSLVALFGFLFTIRQLSVARQSHLFNVYNDAMELLDAKEIREARHWVHARSADQIVLETGVAKNLRDRTADEIEATSIVEVLARNLDRFGLLTRTGRIPEELIAQFYVVPIVKSWEHLSSYVNQERARRGQWGHMWEFENLAWTVAEYATEGKGVWADVKQHEDISALLKNLPALHPESRERRRTRPTKRWRLSSWFSW